jgi:hypothetical protein
MYKNTSFVEKAIKRNEDSKNLFIAKIDRIKDDKEVEETKDRLKTIKEKREEELKKLENLKTDEKVEETKEERIEKPKDAIEVLLGGFARVLEEASIVYAQNNRVKEETKRNEITMEEGGKDRTGVA